MKLTVLAVLIVAGPLAAEIHLLPATIQEGRDSMDDALFNERVAGAEKAGIDLGRAFPRYSVAARKGERLFVLFYNHAEATDCQRDYLIQRVKLTKTSFDPQGVPLPAPAEYLVEVMKLNNHKRTKKPDEHKKGYSLQSASRRKVVTEYEIGCGEIPGVAEGLKWPFESNKLYRLTQNYQTDPGLYHQVWFDDSLTYRLDVDFNDEGDYRVGLPSFVPQDGRSINSVQPLVVR